MSRAALALLLLGLAAMSAALYWGLRGGGFGGDEEISFSRFVRDLQAGQIEQLRVSGRVATGRTKDGKTFRTTLPYLDPQLADDMAEHAEVTFGDPWPESSPSVWWAAPLALVVGYLAGRAAGGARG
jgi:ATP-dependent Zn protease